MSFCVQVFETSPFFSFHHCNAYEHDKYITVDTVAWDELSFSGFNVDSLSSAYYRCGVSAAAAKFTSHGVAACASFQGRMTLT